MNNELSQQIYRFLLKIPKNKVVSYGSIAILFHCHPRTVARILAANKEINTFPCYKVICGNGAVGGYNQGVEEKIKRLMADGIPISNQKVPKEYFWTA